jgi:hypothetical protein
VYVFDKTVGQNNRWRCSKRPCKGSIILNTNNEEISSVEHTCVAEEFKSEKNLALRAIKDKIATTRTPIIEVITEVTKELNNNVISILPRFETLRDDETRKRNKIDNFVVKTEDIPEILRMTLTNKPFLQYDSGQNNDDSIIIFYRRKYSIK